MRAVSFCNASIARTSSLKRSIKKTDNNLGSNNLFPPPPAFPFPLHSTSCFSFSSCETKRRISFIFLAQIGRRVKIEATCFFLFFRPDRPAQKALNWIMGNFPLLCCCSGRIEREIDPISSVSVDGGFGPAREEKKIITRRKIFGERAALQTFNST